MSSPHDLTLKHVLDIIKKDPLAELECRFITAPVSEYPDYRRDVEFERIKEITGMCKESTHWKR